MCWIFTFSCGLVQPPIAVSAATVHGCRERVSSPPRV